MSAFKVEADFGRFIDLSGDLIQTGAGQVAGISPAFTASNPVNVIGYDWIFWRVNYVSTTGAPTLVTFQPESLDQTDPTTAGADWSPLPYEPAVAGTGLAPFYDYQPQRAIWTVGEVKVLRTPCFETWMRLKIMTDAAALTETVFSVRAMRQRIGGPKAN